MGGGGFALGLMESGVLWLWGPDVAGEAAGLGAAEMARCLVPDCEATSVPAPGDAMD